MRNVAEIFFIIISEVQSTKKYLLNQDNPMFLWWYRFFFVTLQRPRQRRNGFIPTPTHNLPIHHTLHNQQNTMRSISPLIVFLAIYLGTSIILQDFYKIPIAVAFLISAIYAILTAHGNLRHRISLFTRGAGDENLQLMLLIFFLAGAFATTAKSVGAVDSTVNMTLSLLPSSFILPGIFLASCFVSFSIGTSCGTIAALTPVAVGIAQTAGFPLPLMVGLIVGGTYFGDNLSFISDTTIIATQTQHCRMKDKFRTNIKIVLPVALLLLVVYYFIGRSINTTPAIDSYDPILILPYLFVIVSAILGLHVVIVLLIGLVLTGIIGIAQGTLTAFTYLSTINEGMLSMAELVFCTIIAGGMLAIIRAEGGVDLIIRTITRHINSKKGGEAAIALLVTLVNVCTANNTVAIITAGPIARPIAERFGISPQRAASILDTMSCFAQGLLPYGAQVLIAASLSGLSPIEILSTLYYPLLIGVAVIITIIFRPIKFNK